MSALADLRTLRAFAVVAREGSVTRAAEQLHITQPAISLQLKRLAAETGTTLFRRTSRGLELTRDGALLAAKAEQVLAAAVDFSQTARQLTAQVRGRLRIGTIVDPEFTRLGAFLKALVETGPGIEAELRHGMSGEVPLGLERDELDVGFYLGDIADLGRGADMPFHVRKLARLRYRVVAPPALGALVRGCEWADLAMLPWIGTPPASVHQRLLAGVFDRLRTRQNTVALVDQETSMLAMVRAGVGLSLCRESIALDQQQAHGLVIADRVSLETSLSFMVLSGRRLETIILRALDSIDRTWAPCQLEG